MENLEQLIKNLVKLPKETSWVEFKRNYYEGEMACIKFVLNEHLTNSSLRASLGFDSVFREMQIFATILL